MSLNDTQLLISRDKLFRLRGLDKVLSRSESARSGSGKLRGLCPDICPEKERYSRAAKNQLRIYEKAESGTDSAVDHRAAIKEYSRYVVTMERSLKQQMLGTQLDYQHSIMDLKMRIKSQV